jgi:hypothetical protein
METLKAQAQSVIAKRNSAAPGTVVVIRESG